MQENEIKILGLINEDGYESVNRVYDTDGLSPTINTCQGGNHEPKILLIRQATKEGYIPCKIGGGW